MRPQVGDIVQVKEEVLRELASGALPRGGLVIRLVEWPRDARNVVDCVVFHDPSFVNPVQLQTRYIEVISRG